MPFKIVLLLLLSIGFAIFTLQNTDVSTVSFLTWSAEVPQALVILISVATGGLLVFLVGMVREFGLHSRLRGVRGEAHELQDQAAELEDRVARLEDENERLHAENQRLQTGSEDLREQVRALQLRLADAAATTKSSAGEPSEDHPSAERPADATATDRPAADNAGTDSRGSGSTSSQQEDLS